MFIYYFNFNSYALYNPTFFILVTSSLSFLIFLLVFVELEAIKWNPSFHYVPCVSRPRSLFISLFNLSWYYDLPHFWTMFFPLQDRSTFNAAQMSLVDRNYALLNQTMEDAANNGGQNANGNEESNVANQNPLIQHDLFPPQNILQNQNL